MSGMNFNIKERGNGVMSIRIDFVPAKFTDEGNKTFAQKLGRLIVEQIETGLSDEEPAVDMGEAKDGIVKKTLKRKTSKQGCAAEEKKRRK